jgi:hypothetical protein
MMIDEFPKSVAKDSGRQHHSVNHGAGEYARADIQSNTTEEFFSLLKRDINGVYHHVGRGHSIWRHA